MTPATENRIRGHVRDANSMFPKGVFIKLHGVLAPFLEGPDINCMGAIVRYIAEDPDAPACRHGAVTRSIGRIE
jgi:hypothetical protein